MFSNISLRAAEILILPLPSATVMSPVVSVVRSKAPSEFNSTSMFLYIFSIPSIVDNEMMFLVACAPAWKMLKYSMTSFIVKSVPINRPVSGFTFFFIGVLSLSIFLDMLPLVTAPRSWIFSNWNTPVLSLKSLFT